MSESEEEFVLVNFTGESTELMDSPLERERERAPRTMPVLDRYGHLTKKLKKIALFKSPVTFTGEGGEQINDRLIKIVSTEVSFFT